MLLNKTAKVKWHPRNKKHYENLGYKYTKIGDEFEVLVEHLTEGSKAEVQWKCDGEGCNKIIVGKYKTYRNTLKDGKIYCKKCIKQISTIDNIRKTLLKDNKSFEDWCLEYNRQDLLSRWDYDKNDCKPSKIGYGTGQDFWFKCDKNPEHKSELKNINSFTSGCSKSGMDCKQCNSIMQYCIDNNCVNELNIEKNKELGLDLWKIAKGSHAKIWFLCKEKDYHNDNGGYVKRCIDFTQGQRCPHCHGTKVVHSKDSLGQYIIDNFGEEFLYKVWSNKNDISPFEIAPNSNKEVWWNCLNGKHDPYLRICSNSKQYDYRCPECNNISKGENKIENILIKYNIKYNPQYTYKDCKSINLLRFDFYLLDYNMCIEYDGKQHYLYGCFNGDLLDLMNIKYRDAIKNIYCQQNNIKLIRIPYWEYNNIEEILKKELDIK